MINGRKQGKRILFLKRSTFISKSKQNKQKQSVPVICFPFFTFSKPMCNYALNLYS
jgi:hypothetical protein